MRIVVLLAAALLLPGCTYADRSRAELGSLGVASAFPTDDRPDFTLISANPGLQRLPPKQRCEFASRSRSNDALLQGFDEGLQQRVRETVYAHCMKWMMRSASR
jgi:hypothetical protein